MEIGCLFRQMGNKENSKNIFLNDMKTRERKTTITTTTTTTTTQTTD